MNRLEKCLLQELFCTTCDKRFMLLHLIIALFVANLSVSGDVFSVERGNQTILFCHTCEIDTNDLVGFKTAPKRYWSKTKYALERRQNLEEERRNKLRAIEEMSMHSVDSSLVQFLCVCIHPSVEIYVVFCLEPEHNLTFRVSRLLEECFCSCWVMKIEKLLQSEQAPQNAKPLKLIRLQSFQPFTDFILTLQNDSYNLVFGWTLQNRT